MELERSKMMRWYLYEQEHRPCTEIFPMGSWGTVSLNHFFQTSGMSETGRSKKAHIRAAG